MLPKDNVYHYLEGERERGLKVRGAHVDMKITSALGRPINYP
jgi:hypothetical protein